MDPRYPFLAIAIAIAVSACSSAPDTEAEDNDDTSDELVTGGRFVSPLAPGIYDSVEGAGSIAVGTTSTAVEVLLEGQPLCDVLLADVSSKVIKLHSATRTCEANVALTPTSDGFSATGTYTKQEASLSTVTLQGSFRRRQPGALSGRYVQTQFGQLTDVGLEVVTADDATLALRVDGADGSTRALTASLPVARQSAAGVVLVGQPASFEYLATTPQCRLLVVPRKVRGGYEIDMGALAGCSDTFLEPTRFFVRR